MSAVIRAFRRADGEQVTALVNAHVQAVLPGVSVPQNAVLGQLERDPGEFIVDPWVEERRLLVAESRGRIVAAALLHRYADGEHVERVVSRQRLDRVLMPAPTIEQTPVGGQAGEAHLADEAWRDLRRIRHWAQSRLSAAWPTRRRRRPARAIAARRAEAM